MLGLFLHAELPHELPTVICGRLNFNPFCFVFSLNNAHSYEGIREGHRFKTRRGLSHRFSANGLSNLLTAQC